MKKSDCDIIKVDYWEAPDNGVKLLTMPNIPYPLFGQAPRTLLGNQTWNHMRSACYANANDTCEACGYKPDNKRYRHAHELYSVDYATQTVTFERATCLCYRCHVLGIHTGRALTMYRHNSAMYQASQLLEGAEHVFSLVSEYNKTHPDEEPLRLFSAWVDYLKEPELAPKMEELIKKYDVKFYDVSNKWYNKKRWSNWKLVIGNRTYYTPYESHTQLNEIYEEKNKTNVERNAKDPFVGGVFDEVNKILEKSLTTP